MSTPVKLILFSIATTFLIVGCRTRLSENTQITIILTQPFTKTGGVNLEVVPADEKDLPSYAFDGTTPIFTMSPSFFNNKETVIIEWSNSSNYDYNYALERFVFRLSGLNDTMYITKPMYLKGDEFITWRPMDETDARNTDGDCVIGRFFNEEMASQWEFGDSTFSADLELEKDVEVEGIYQILTENTIRLEYTRYQVDRIEQSLPNEPDLLDLKCMPEGITLNGEFYERSTY